MCVRVCVSESDHSGLRARGRHQVSWVRARDHGEMKRPGRIGWEDKLWLVGRGGKKIYQNSRSLHWSKRCVVKRHESIRKGAGVFVEDDWGRRGNERTNSLRIDRSFFCASLRSSVRTHARAYRSLGELLVLFCHCWATIMMICFFSSYYLFFSPIAYSYTSILYLRRDGMAYSSAINVL